MFFYTVSLRYAKALIDLCNEEKLTDKVYADMKEMQNLLFESSELRSLLKTPQIDDKTKSRLVKQVFEPHFQHITVSFLTLLIKKGRSNLIIYIVLRFIELYREQTGIVLAQVKTAIPMTEAMRQKITDKVRAATGQEKVELEELVDKRLLGGFQLYYNGQSYDASVTSELKKVKSVLTDKQKHHNC